MLYEAENLISVFPMIHPKERFDENGVILMPTLCDITEELNGDYSLVMNHPIDDFGRWKYILPFSIIKACGQLFRIYRMQTTMSSDGSMQRTVYARHIFYDWNEKIISYAYVNNLVAHDYIAEILKPINLYDDAQGYPFYNFDWHSDITKRTTTSVSDISVAAAILGTSNSVITRCGGELHRDNFWFSLYERKEGSVDNAFNIRYGVDMIDIQENIDYSSFISNLIAKDNFGNEFNLSYDHSNDFPHNYTKVIKFNYQQNDIEQLKADGRSYFNKYKVPNMAYKVTFANLSDTELYKDFKNLSRCNIGDTGMIKNEMLGISTNEKVVKKVTDAIKNKTKSIQLNSLSKYLTQYNAFDSVIAPKTPSGSDGLFVYQK